MVRSVGFGVASAAILIWLTFFATAGAVELATLVAVGVSFWWFATVDPSRLVDEAGRPHVMLFALAAVGTALLVTAAALISSATTLLMLGLGIGAIVVGMTRTIRHGLDRPAPEE